MEITDSEKQHLIDPLGWASSQDSASSSSSEVSNDEEDLWLCEETGRTSEAERDVKRSARRKLYIACFVGLVFMIGEVIGGYAAHSLAIMTDAAHLVTDVGSIAINIFSLWLSSRPKTQNMTFGWHRAEILGMFLSVVSIWAVTAVLVLSAAQRISDGDYDIDSQIMIITSGCAVGINILMVLILHQSGASHGHSHSLSSGRRQEERHGHSHHHGNASVKAAFVHVVGDLVQSVGVLLAATIIHIWPEYKIADPICTFLFSVLVLGTTLPVTKEVFRILMEGTPRDVDTDSVRKQLLSVRGVVAVHSLHMWSLNMTHAFLSAHVNTEEGADAQIVLMKATKLLHSEFGFSSVTIQVER